MIITRIFFTIFLFCNASLLHGMAAALQQKAVRADIAFQRLAIPWHNHFYTKAFAADRSAFDAHMSYLSALQRHAFETSLHDRFAQNALSSVPGTYALISKAQLLDQQINHVAHVLSQCCMPNTSKLHLLSFIDLKICHSTLNNFLIDCKEKMAPLLFTGNGLPRAIAQHEYQKLTACVEQFFKQVNVWKENQFHTIASELKKHPNEYPCFNNKKLEYALRNNGFMAKLKNVAQLLQMHDFNKAAEIINDTSWVRALLSQDYQKACADLVAWYKEQFYKIYDAFGLEKRFAHDPYYQHLYKTLSRQEIGRTASQKLQAHMRQPLPLVHEANKELAWRDYAFTRLCETLRVSHPNEQLSQYLYDFVSVLPDGPQSIAHFLAHTTSGDHYSQEARALHQELFDHQGMPLFYGLDTALLYNVELPKNINELQNASQRECLYNLCLIKTDNQELATTLRTGVEYVTRACDSYSQEVREAYQVLAQSFVHMVYEQQSLKLLECPAFSAAPQTARQMEIRDNILPAVATIAQKITDPRCVSVSEKQQFEILLERIHEFYKQAVIHDNARAQDLLTGLCNNLKKINLTSGPIEQGIYRAKQTIAPVERQKIQQEIAHVLQEGLMLDVPWLKDQPLTKSDIQRINGMVNDKEFVEKTQNMLLDLEKQGSLYPQHMRHVSAREYISYIDAAQNDLVEYLDSLALQRSASPTEQRVKELFLGSTKYTALAATELLKKGISIIDTARHPVQAARDLAAGTRTLLHFVGNVMVAYGKYHGSDDVRLQAQQELAQTFQLLKDLPNHEKFKVLFNVAADMYLMRQFTGILNKTKPFLQKASVQLKSVAQSVQQTLEQFETIKKLRNYIWGEVKAIELIEHAQVATQEVVITAAERMKCFEKIESLYEIGKPKSIKDLKFDSMLIARDGVTIKCFPMCTIKDRWSHIFSEKHVQKGILNLGRNQAEIIEKIVRVILKADRKGLLENNIVNTIETMLNGEFILLKAFIKDGEIIGINCYGNITDTSRRLGNIISVLPD